MEKMRLGNEDYHFVYGQRRIPAIPLERALALASFIDLDPTASLTEQRAALAKQEVTT